jgi:hypothetical protein
MSGANRIPPKITDEEFFNIHARYPGEVNYPYGGNMPHKVYRIDFDDETFVNPSSRGDHRKYLGQFGTTHDVFAGTVIENLIPYAFEFLWIYNRTRYIVMDDRHIYPLLEQK